ncbi:hypothetical protein [Streptomyces sp. BA2]|uniref:hypothetical protein n=1 Tax=Streptomyces sp. BA2 TaxID=436595 RepID=UPI00132AEE9C|nr:hypothetical protein [Streptomyces sp. BA2]MWA07804.1 hypothetical protein [Streptomyces sp. BA2]
MTYNGLFSAAFCLIAQAGDEEAAYFLSGAEYTRFAWGPGGTREGGHAEGGGRTSALLPSIPHLWRCGLDAVCVFGRDATYFFQWNKYLVYSPEDDETAAPGRVSDITPFTRIDAAITCTSGATSRKLAYFFSGDRVYAFDPARPGEGEDASIAEALPWLPRYFRRGIDCAVTTADGATAYLFRGRYFIQLSSRSLTDQEDIAGVGDVLPLNPTTWPGLHHVDPARRWSTGDEGAQVAPAPTPASEQTAVVRGGLG